MTKTWTLEKCDAMLMYAYDQLGELLDEIKTEVEFDEENFDSESALKELDLLLNSIELIRTKRVSLAMALKVRAENEAKTV